MHIDEKTIKQALLTGEWVMRKEVRCMMKTRCTIP